MSNQSPQDYPQKKKNRRKSFDNTRIGLQAFVIVVGAVAGNKASDIITEIAHAIPELRSPVINPADLLILLVFSMLLVSLLRLILETADDGVLLEEADEVILELEDSQSSRLASIDEVSSKDKEDLEVDSLDTDNFEQQQRHQ